MVDLLHWDEHSLLVAQLTKRMHLNIRISDAFPGTSVPSLDHRVPSVLLVGLVILLRMLLTETILRQLRTAGIGAWSFGSSGHGFLRINEELPPLLVEAPFDSDFMVPL